MNELSEILEEKGRQVLEIEVDGRGRRGRRRRLDRRPRKVQIEAAELRDPVSDRLHHRRLTRAGATSRDGARRASQASSIAVIPFRIASDGPGD